MASIKKLEDRKYFVRVSKGRGKSRQYINETIRGTLKDAQKFAREQETKLDLGQTPIEIKLTFKKHVVDWLAHVKPTVSTVTYNDYERTIRYYAADDLGDKKLAEIEPNDIQGIYDRLLRRGLSPETVWHVHRVLRACFNYAIEQDRLRKNPLRKGVVSLPKKERPDIKFLYPDQASEFVAECRKTKNGLIFEFALETGMRPEEYLALRWRDLDLVRNTASINRAVVYQDGGGFTFEPTKTKRSRRLVPISPSLTDALLSHRQKQSANKTKLLVGYADYDLVFANQVGNPHSMKNLYNRHLVPLLQKCNIQDSGLTLYSLRHSCATLLLALGVNPKVVADRLGHASVAMTLDTYSHLTPGIQAAATEKLNMILRKTEQETT